MKREDSPSASSTQYFDDSPFYAEASFVMQTSSSSCETSRDVNSGKYPPKSLVQIKRLRSIKEKGNNTQINRDDNREKNTAINHLHDVTTARGWMENIQQNEGSLYGVGAYTVLRCDIMYPVEKKKENSRESEMYLKKCQCRVWGREFHLNRLISSFEMLLRSRLDDEKDLAVISSAVVREVKEETCRLMDELLDAAKRFLFQNLSSYTPTQQYDYVEKDFQPFINSDPHTFVRTLMMTVLWTPPNADYATGEDGNFKPIIRCHAAFAGSSRHFDIQNEENSLAPPISVCLAIPDTPGFEELAKLPKRHSPSCFDYPFQTIGASAKVSSWCHQRRPLEDPNRYKPSGSGVEEVLLLRQSKESVGDDDTSHRNEESAANDFITSLEILEGLTSNLFVIYKDKTVRTAPIGSVLSGYARQLVIEELGDKSTSSADSSCRGIIEGLVLDDINPPTVEDAMRGLWSEVFVTSAIRLITPVNRVLIPPVDGVTLEDGHNTISGNQSILWDAERHGNGLGSVIRALRSAVYRRGYNNANLRYPI